jgi:hypothetical protein
MIAIEKNIPDIPKFIMIDYNGGISFAKKKKKKTRKIVNDIFSP